MPFLVTILVLTVARSPSMRSPTIDDLLTAVQLDLGDVGALEQVGEEPDELRPLRLREGLPVAAQGATGDLREIEELIGDLANRRAPIALPCPRP